MKGIIIYKSQNGCTKQYAEWLAAETGLKAINVKKVKKRDIEQAETVVVGSAVINFSPTLKKWMHKRKELLLSKRLFMFTTSGAAGSDPNLLKAFRNDFDESWQTNMTYVPLSGRFILKELPWILQFIMKQVQKSMKDPVVKANMLKDKDGMNEAELTPLIDAIEAAEKKEAPENESIHAV